MLENRTITFRIFPDQLPRNNVLPVKEYPNLLLKNLMALANRQTSEPTVVLLTPGIYNSAYFEHTTLARLMGIELVEGRDLVVDNNRVFMKTTKGLKRVDVIYRRIDDEYIDPLVFRPDSMLGVPGLYWAYRKGNVSIVNAMGNGVADDKAIYAYVPDMIRYYLNEEPILKNIPTYPLAIEENRKTVFGEMEKMVIKRTNQSGGYGMLIGNSATKEQMDEFRIAIEEDPRNFIAQPIINLSSSPCYINGVLQPRRVDLRPYALYGPDGKKVYLEGLRSNMLTVVNTADQKIVRQVGPFINHVRPFTIDANQSRCFVNADSLLGFEVGDLNTGKKIAHVEVEGFQMGSVKRHGCPSHGIALTPDENEIWLADAFNESVHVFDIAQNKIRQEKSIKVSDQPGWITFTIDGKYAMPSTGDIIDAKKREIIATLVDETGARVQSEKMVEVQFEGTKLVRAGDQFGIGRASISNRQ
jgi:hypothetical protein